MSAGAAGGPNSPLALIYFLIIALAGLRFNLPLIWMATLPARRWQKLRRN